MAHEVRARIDTQVITSKDLKIEVRTTDGKLGTLLISKGNIEWLPTGNFVNKRRLSWEQFAEFMESHGRPAKVR